MPREAFWNGREQFRLVCLVTLISAVSNGIIVYERRVSIRNYVLPVFVTQCSQFSDYYLDSFIVVPSLSSWITQTTRTMWPHHIKFKRFTSLSGGANLWPLIRAIDFLGMHFMHFDSFRLSPTEAENQLARKVQSGKKNSSQDKAICCCSSLNPAKKDHHHHRTERNTKVVKKSNKIESQLGKNTTVSPLLEETQKSKVKNMYALWLDSLAPLSRCSFAWGTKKRRPFGRRRLCRESLTWIKKLFFSVPQSSSGTRWEWGANFPINS